MRSRKLPTPHTEILYKDEAKRLAEMVEPLGFPLVLKVPDGSFSRGIVKVANPDELKAGADTLFQQSSLLLAQEFMPTEFDWRIGILNREPLYACQYFMSRGHWQIYNHDAARGSDRSGSFRTGLRRRHAGQGRQAHPRRHLSERRLHSFQGAARFLTAVPQLAASVW